MLGVLYALGAFTFALNNVTMRRGVVTGSVLQGMALTVPIGGLSFLVMTIAFGELGQLAMFPTAAFTWLACQGVVHFVIGGPGPVTIPDTRLFLSEGRSISPANSSRS